MSESSPHPHFLIADSRCFDQKLNPIEITVYLRICMRAHKSTCYESVAHLAQACGTSSKSVQRALKKLTSLKMIALDSGKTVGSTNNIKLVPYENWVTVTEGVGLCDRGGRTQVRRGWDCVTEGVGLCDRHNSTQDQYPGSVPISLADRREKEEKISDQKIISLGISLSVAIRRAYRRPFFDNGLAADLVRQIFDRGMTLDSLRDTIDDIERVRFLTSLKPSDIVTEIVNHPAQKQAQISKFDPATIQSQPTPIKIESKPNLPHSKPNTDFVQKTDNMAIPEPLSLWLSALPRREQRNFAQEIKMMGVPMFIDHRLPALPQAFFSKYGSPPVF